MSKGTVFNIEEFAVHDGPGIRKLVFFKGCPLRCSWCHNPEGLSFCKELMISHAACIKCNRCKEICTNEVCIACGKCVEVCPLRLRKIAGREYEAQELAEILLKGKEVLTDSGGGITISGGEPLSQPEFLFNLIDFIKPVNIAIETSGYAEPEIFQKMVSVTDLVMMDIKHTDNLIHKQFTGVSNELILANLGFLCQSDTPFIIRIPLIPGVNDTITNIEQTAVLIKDAGKLEGVELLTYHKTAPAKYQMLGKEFKPGFDTEKKVNIWSAVFDKHNIKVSLL
ncbi:MAG: glycyl-radical enzyme activating protein [Bacteroidetes bacterium]|nr:glycyl-radical enzyme activating protein [Bacteroidota bacterium]